VEGKARPYINLKKQEGKEGEMSYSQESINYVAERLEVDSRFLASLLSRRNSLYKTWYKRKIGGGKRCIEAPVKELKEIQKIILKKLSLNLPECVQGGVLGKSIRTNALQHKSNKYLLRMDIKDAYPSVTRKKVYALFKKWGAPAEVAKIYAKILTFRDRLPQGAPTSLAIFNLLLKDIGLDFALSHIKGIQYTRYVDDLVLTSKKPIPEWVEKQTTIFLKENSFSINERKTRCYSIKNRALRITGVNIINGKPKVPPKLIKKFRGMIHRALSDDSISKEKVFGSIAFVIGIEKKIPNQLLKPLLRYLEVKNIKECPFVIY
jgi:hypothetical protein